VQYKPDIDANFSVQYDNASENTIAGVQISIPLPIYDRNQGGVQQAIGEIVVAEQRMQRVQVGLQTRLAPVYADYAAARYQADQYRREVLPKAKENYELLESAYKAGEIDFLSLLTAQRTYFQANLAYIEALRQLRLKQAEMKGLLLSTSLEQDP
jgi:cobalt-zinc-cadmium efflux system outer membrane protein